MRRRKRYLKSIYFDRYTNTLGQACSFDQYPAARPHRYLFIGQFSYRPTTLNKKVLAVLEASGITLTKLKPVFGRKSTSWLL